jgi:hypothetical protein
MDTSIFTSVTAVAQAVSAVLATLLIALPLLKKIQNLKFL